MPLTVEDICKLYIKDPLKVANCNEFVQSVAAKVASEWGMDLSQAFAGNADLIRSRFGVPPFVLIGPHPGEATRQANAGQFVIGGLRHTEMTYTGKDGILRKATMGHVVVIAPGGPSSSIKEVTLANGKKQPARGGYPYCYQGAAHEEYRFTDRTQVDVVFPGPLLNKVIYAYIKIPKKQVS